MLSENLPLFDFRECPHHPTMLNDPTSRNAVDLNQVNMEARKLAHLYLSTNQEIFNSGT
jgi:hypothetical protein